MTVYRVPYTGTVTAAGGNTDLLAVTPAANKPVRLKGMKISQTSNVQDANEHAYQISIHRMTATVTLGSGGSTPTPSKPSTAAQAAGFTAHCNDATVATTSGTDEIVEYLGWNDRVTPFETWWSDPEDRLLVINGEGLIVRLDSTVAADTTVQLTFFVEELSA